MGELLGCLGCHIKNLFKTRTNMGSIQLKMNQMNKRAVFNELTAVAMSPSKPKLQQKIKINFDSIHVDLGVNNPLFVSFNGYGITTFVHRSPSVKITYEQAILKIIKARLRDESEH